MPLVFRKTENHLTPSVGYDVVYLKTDNWDDYSFKTLFSLVIVFANGQTNDIGEIKIGYKEQIAPSRTSEMLPIEFNSLGKDYFSLGQDAEYYQNLCKLTPEIKDELLICLKDIVANPSLLSEVENQDVFQTSLLRSVSFPSISNQLLRVLNGGALLTQFHFKYEKKQTESYAGLSLDFHVNPSTKPSTNIHILIGRNGIGKTTILNNMISSLVDTTVSSTEVGAFTDISTYYLQQDISLDYFTNIVSISFSAFDPFTPPEEQINSSLGISYSYIGLKSIFIDDNGERKSTHKTLSELGEDFVTSLSLCLSTPRKKERWLNAISVLESDMNFAEMGLHMLADNIDSLELRRRADNLYSRMSSGHAIIILTVTKLIERVEEKTLVLMDEPESHLHPPLLSAFIRALSSLLNNRNGVAIIATHSPVILQEVPKSCVWIIRRTRLEASTERPESETFGENVGILTREVFGLEVSKSGFHDLLAASVDSGKSFEEILQEYDGQIGFEGQVILRSLIANRESGNI